MANEINVAVTDLILVAECGFFVLYLYRRGRVGTLRNWLMVLFASTSLSALTGAVVHGFFSDVASQGHAVFWLLTMVVIGVTTLAAWAIGGMLLFPARAARGVIFGAALQYILYILGVLFFTQEFWFVIVNYLPAMIFLLVVFCVSFFRRREIKILSGIAGILLIFTASAAQYLRIDIHPVYLNYNVLYHLIMAAALFLLFEAARWLVKGEGK